MVPEKFVCVRVTLFHRCLTRLSHERPTFAYIISALAVMHVALTKGQLAQPGSGPPTGNIAGAAGAAAGDESGSDAGSSDDHALQGRHSAAIVPVGSNDLAECEDEGVCEDDKNENESEMCDRDQGKSESEEDCGEVGLEELGVDYNALVTEKTAIGVAGGGEGAHIHTGSGGGGGAHTGAQQKRLWHTGYEP